MNILTLGGWYVGNTAILDWLSDFDAVSVVPGDFHVFRVEGGILDIVAEQDLQKKLDLAIRLRSKYLKNTAFFFKWRLGKLTKYAFKKRRKTYGYYFHFNYKLLRRLSRYIEIIREDREFNEIDYWKKWVGELVNIFGEHGNVLTSFQNPCYYHLMAPHQTSVWEQLFSPYKIIFVHRDPLDQYAQIVKAGAHLSSGNKRFYGESDNLTPEERFFYVSKRIFDGRIQMLKDYGPEQLAVISFEGFVRDHEAVSERLKYFLSIENDQRNTYEKFQPQKSISNIGIGQSVQVANSDSMTDLYKYRDILAAMPHSLG